MNALRLIRGESAAAISESVEQAIRAGRIDAGELLPTVRALADALRVSPATVAAAYQALRLRGLINARGRRGTRVCMTPQRRAVLPLVLPPNVRDLSNGYPDLRLLPSLQRVLSRVDLGPTSREPPDHAGLAEIAKRDFREVGVPAESICVVNGALDGIERVLAEHLRPGDRVAVEDPGFGTIFDLITSRGLTIAPMRLDEHGVIPDELERVCREGIEAIILTPRCHNPLGVSFDASRARELSRVLKRFPDALVVEDDHMNLVSDVDLHSVCSASIQRWAHVRSFAKSLSPDLRVAVMTGDERTVSRVQDRLIVGRRWVSPIVQSLAHALLADTEVRSSFQKAARIYAARRQALCESLASLGIRLVARSGINIWAPVPEETPVVQALAAAGWAIRAGERFRIESPPAVRITVATLDTREAPQLASDFVAVLRTSVISNN